MVELALDYSTPVILAHQRPQTRPVTGTSHAIRDSCHEIAESQLAAIPLAHAGVRPRLLSWHRDRRASQIAVIETSP